MKCESDKMSWIFYSLCCCVYLWLPSLLPHGYRRIFRFYFPFPFWIVRARAPACVRASVCVLAVLPKWKCLYYLRCADSLFFFFSFSFLSHVVVFLRRLESYVDDCAYVLLPALWEHVCVCESLALIPFGQNSTLHANAVSRSEKTEIHRGRCPNIGIEITYSLLTSTEKTHTHTEAEKREKKNESWKCRANTQQRIKRIGSSSSSPPCGEWSACVCVCRFEFATRGWAYEQISIYSLHDNQLGPFRGERKCTKRPTIVLKNGERGRAAASTATKKEAKSKLRSDTFHVDPVDVIWIVPDLHLMVKTKMYFARYHLLLAVCNVYRRGGGAWLVRGSENSDLFIHITHSGDRRCTDTHTLTHNINWQILTPIDFIVFSFSPQIPANWLWAPCATLNIQYSTHTPPPLVHKCK